MYVFGGWVPYQVDQNAVTIDKDWKCTNTLGVFNLETLCWDYVSTDSNDENVPRARAGHSAVASNSRLYIWSGRDGYRKAWNNQVCCKDMWILETESPTVPVKLQLTKSSVNSLDISWGSVPYADSYIVQIQKIDTPLVSVPENPLISKKFAVPSSLPNSTPFAISPIVNHSSNPSLVAVSVTGTNVQSTPLKVVSIAKPSVVVSAAPGPAPLVVSSTVLPVSTIKQEDVSVSLATSGVVQASQLSGMAALAAAAEVTQKIQAPITPTTSAVTKALTGGSLRIVSPQIVSSTAAGIKQTPTIRLISSSTGGVAKANQIFVKTVAGQAPQFMTVVRTPDGQITLAPRLASVMGGQMVKVVPQGVLVKPTVQNIITSTQTGSIHPNSSVPAPVSLANTIRLTVPVSSAQPKMVNPPPRSKLVVARPQTHLNITPTGQVQGGQVIRLSATNQQFKIPVSSFKGGSSKIVFPATSGHTVRLIPSTSGSSTTGQRIVFIPTSQSSSPTVASLDQSQSVTTKPAQAEPPVSTESIAKIPQTDGPGDELPPPTTTSSFSSLNNFHLEQPSAELPLQMLSDDPDPIPPVTSQSQTSNESTENPLAAFAAVISNTLANSNNLSSQLASATSSKIESGSTLNGETNGSLAKATVVKDHWYDVGLFKTNQATITSFNVPPPHLESDYDPERSIDTFSLPKYGAYTKFNLEAGTSYKIRVAAINSVGRSDWSDTVVFKTCLPGFPSAPTSIKISKNVEGASLSWSLPNRTPGDETEFSVLLAVRPPQAMTTTPINSQQLCFTKVYSGPANSCIIAKHVLDEGYLDHTSGKPSIIFRIGAKNQKGVGPSTQVRWIQDNVTSATNPNTPQNKRPGPSDAPS